MPIFMGCLFWMGAYDPNFMHFVLPIFHGKDLLVHIPTGGGKSLCMFLGVLQYSLERS